MCLGGPKGLLPDRPYVSLVNCDTTATGADDHPPLNFTLQENGYLVEASTGKCVGLADGNIESGALLELQDCVDTSGEMKYDKEHIRAAAPQGRKSEASLSYAPNQIARERPGFSSSVPASAVSILREHQ